MPRGSKSKLRFQNLTGRKFDRWLVIAYAGNRRWRCRCVCGRERLVYPPNLKKGLSKSCGCLRAEMLRAKQLAANEVLKALTTSNV